MGGWKDIYGCSLPPDSLTIDNHKLLAFPLSLPGQVLLDLGQTGRTGWGEGGEEGGEGDGLGGCLMMGEREGG